ncbi:MAG: ABC transporter permease, partial [Bacteroidales bacterium]|nr:ABC transporter permease [Bacteroidales bacterium]
MNISNLFKIALRAIANNKMRSLLTMLGIIIGIASVIVMLAIGQGAKNSILTEISSMGSNMITIMPGNGQFGGVRQSASSMQTLKQADYDAIREECTTYVSHVSPLAQSSGQAIYSSANTPTSMYGVSDEYLDIKNLHITDGEMFSEQDIKTSAKVCVLGKTVIENLFGDNTDPIGRTIRFNKIPFRIIGVLEEKGNNNMGMDQDDVILAPYTTVQKRILASTSFGSIIASARSEEVSELAVKDIETVLRNNHKIKSADDDDFHVRTLQEIMEMVSSTTNTITLLLTCIAGISLLVGGIGIMNIMFVSVTERTREIGLRMSIGAKSYDILLQFLLESVLISVVGGIIGVIVGILAAYAAKHVANVAITIQTYT